MAYSTDVQIHTTFDSYPLINDVTGSFYTSVGTTQTIVDGVFDNAWKMAETSYVYITDPLNPSTGCTIGFWLNSVNPGIVTGPSNTVLPLLMPVLSKAVFTYGTTVTSTTWTFIVWEETQTDGTNILKASFRGLKGASIVTATIASTPYQVGVFHYFWIVFDGNNQQLTLYVDTLEDITAIITGTIPSQLSSNGASLSINNNVLGTKTQIARNSGIIDDLIVFTSVQNNPATVVRAANSGSNYVGDMNYSSVKEIDQIAIFDDPGTAQINAVYSNRGQVYVGRSDGQLLRGSKLLWETKFDFYNNTQLDEIQLITKSAGGYARISAGNLKLQDNIARV